MQNVCPCILSTLLSTDKKFWILGRTAVVAEKTTDFYCFSFNWQQRFCSHLYCFFCVNPQGNSAKLFLCISGGTCVQKWRCICRYFLYQETDDQQQTLLGITSYCFVFFGRHCLPQTTWVCICESDLGIAMCRFFATRKLFQWLLKWDMRVKAPDTSINLIIGIQVPYLNDMGPWK